MSKEQKPPHEPVLVREVLELLKPSLGESYLDLTAGAGGHAAAVIRLTKAPKKAVLVDRDAEAIELLENQFKQSRIIHSDFLSASQQLAASGAKFDMILLDLGVSSLHLDKAERGFSIKLSGPLDMRMDAGQSLSADHIVNKWDEKSLIRIFRDYGQEPKAREIARKIVARRPIKTTDSLAAIAASAWQGRSKVHPATRTFQAIRIAVNGELDQLEGSLPLTTKLLAPSGRLALISFHSLEDRIVKNFLAEHGGETYDSDFQLLTKKPVKAGEKELISNPRARSANLRAAAKIKT